MSTLAQIRDAIVATHRAVANVGVVHAYERYTRNEDKFRELYVGDFAGVKQIRGWWWRRAATEERSVSIGTVMNVHTWECRGYMVLNDEEATALTFEQLIEDLRDAVRADPTLGGVCEQSPYLDGAGTDGVQVTDSAPVLFCGVLCHSAVLQLKTWSYL